MTRTGWLAAALVLGALLVVLGVAGAFGLAGGHHHAMATRTVAHHDGMTMPMPARAEPHHRARFGGYAGVVGGAAVFGAATGVFALLRRRA
ncbi:MAG: hypothetical protein ACJ73S_09830 [Mycobacteriales bacterium]